MYLSPRDTMIIPYHISCLRVTFQGLAEVRRAIVYQDSSSHDYSLHSKPLQKRSEKCTLQHVKKGNRV